MKKACNGIIFLGLAFASLLLLSCTPYKIEKDVSHYMPFNKFIGEQTLKKDIFYYEHKNKELPKGKFLSGNDIFDKRRGESALPTKKNFDRIILKKGTKLYVDKVIATTFATPTSFIPYPPMKSYDIDAYVRFQAPGTKHQCSAVYDMLSGEKDFMRKTKTIRRAPWEDDTVPESRYVGLMGTEYKGNRVQE